MDVVLFNFLHQLANQSGFLDFVIKFTAEYLGYFLILAALVVIFTTLNFKERFYRGALIFLAVLFSRGIITELIRFIYHRPRPFSVLEILPLFEKSAGAMPSGHAAFYFALAFAVILIGKKFPSQTRLWGWSIFTGAVLMGLARVAAGVHWPTDILAGALVGLFSALLIYYLLPKQQAVSA